MLHVQIDGRRASGRMSDAIVVVVLGMLAYLSLCDRLFMAANDDQLHGLAQ